MNVYMSAELVCMCFFNLKCTRACVCLEGEIEINGVGAGWPLIYTHLSSLLTAVFMRLCVCVARHYHTRFVWCSHFNYVHVGMRICIMCTPLLELVRLCACAAVACVCFNCVHDWVWK